MDPSEYAALRQRIAAASERMLSLQHLGEHERDVPTDRSSALARMRRNVLWGLMDDVVRQPAGAQNTGLVVVDPRGGRHCIAPIRLGAGPTATDDALRTAEQFAAAGDLIQRTQAALDPPVPDPLFGAGCTTLTDNQAAMSIVDVAFADGSALVMAVHHPPVAPSPRTLFSTDPVAEAESPSEPDPLIAPVVPTLFALLTAALPPSPASPASLVGEALRQGWDQVVETQDGSFLVTAWPHAAVHVAVDRVGDDEVVVVRGKVLLDVQLTPELQHFVAECSTSAALATVGILGTGPVDLVVQHGVPLRDMDGEALQLMVTRIGRLADTDVLLLQARFGGRTLR